MTTETSSAASTGTVTLAASGLTPADVLAVARGRARVELDPAARERVAQVRAHVDALARGETPVYGSPPVSGPSPTPPSSRPCASSCSAR